MSLMLASLTAMLVLLEAAIQPARFVLAERLRTGEHLVEHRYSDDRIEWKLPHKRLEPFIRGGAIIHEERHQMIVLRAIVTRTAPGVASLAGSADRTYVDVPRHTQRFTHATFSSVLTEGNDDPGVSMPALEDAAMTDFPRRALGVGDCWTSRRNILTALGSGRAQFRRCVAARSGPLVRITVRANGIITGQEYHLPKLLPGSMELQGDAWYDLDRRLVTQESYRVHNRLLKPAEHESIGFDEILDVDVSTRQIP